MTTKEIISGNIISIDWEFTEVVDTHDNNWCEWALSGTGSDGRKYTGNCQGDFTDPENCHNNEIFDVYPVLPKVIEKTEPMPEQAEQWQQRIASVTGELLKYGIEIKIKSFQEFENATSQLNKLYQDELNY